MFCVLFATATAQTKGKAKEVPSVPKVPELLPGLDKTLSLGDVKHGNGAYPGTKKVYADAFTKELKRPVTVTELEG